MYALYFATLILSPLMYPHDAFQQKAIEKNQKDRK